MSDDRERHLAVLLTLLLVAGPLVLADGARAQETSAFRDHDPAPGAVVHTDQPVVRIGLDPAFAPYDLATLVLVVNGIEVQGQTEDFEAGQDGVEYRVSSLFRLVPGDQSVRIAVADASGLVHEAEYSFTYSTEGPRSEAGVDLLQVALLVVTVLVVLALAGLTAGLFYLFRLKGWSWRKFLVRFRVPREVFVLYVPVAMGLVGAIAALSLRDRIPSPLPFQVECIVLAAVLVGTTPYALDVHRVRRRRRAYERAFAQLLFEMADSVRGGIDPMKAVLELSKSETGLLREPLQGAADALRLGRPFDTVLAHMVQPFGSPLIGRYAQLLAAAASVGGEISGVIYRAAKDMDELVKVDAERVRALRMPVFTIYVAFGVLLMMVKTLMDFGPTLADLDITALTGGTPAAATQAGPAPATAPGRLTVAEMTQRFFHLLLITSMGSGLLVGGFTEGRLRYGLVHMLVMMVLATAFYLGVVV